MSWQLACKLSELGEGQMKMVTLNGVEILLIAREGGISAVPPMCPHMDEPLEHGMCDGKVLTCMKHLWQWDIQSGSPIGEAEAPLAMYDIKVEEDSVYINVVHELAYERGA